MINKLVSLRIFNEYSLFYIIEKRTIVNIERIVDMIKSLTEYHSLNGTNDTNQNWKQYEMQFLYQITSKLFTFYVQPFLNYS